MALPARRTPVRRPGAAAVVYRDSSDRKAEHPRAQLAHFHGFLQADGYPAFGPFYEATNGQPATVTEVACWAHVRRYFYDIHVSTNAPIVGEALQRIGQLFAVERMAIGLPCEQRRRVRQSAARPVIDHRATFLDASLAMISGRSELAKAIRYARSRWTALTRYLDNGTLEISNNTAERAIRPLALGRKNYLFAGSDVGGKRAAAAYTLIETAKLNLDPEAYLREVIGRIADHPINRIADLLPWNIGLASPIRVAA
jgi:transposase